MKHSTTTKALLTALGMALLWFAVCALVFGVRYEVNDDAIISNIAAGAYGGQTQYLIYPNILLGWLLKLPYAIIPGVNWFVVGQMAVGLLCFAYIGSLLLRRLGGLAGGMAHMALLVLAGTELFTRFHYVRYAAVLLATGFLLLALHLGRWDRGTLAGMLLVLAGSLLRFEQLAATGGIALAFLLYRFLLLGAPAKKRALACAAATAAAVLLCFGADKLAYAADPQWSAYMEYNKARMEVSDYRVTLLRDYEQAAALGLSGTEYDLLNSWSFYDTEQFDTERLTQLAKTLPGNTLANTLKTALAAGAGAFYGRAINLLLAAVVLLWLFFGKKRAGWAPLLGTLAGLGVMLLYLAWRARVLERVEYGLIYTAILFCGAVWLTAAPGGTRIQAGRQKTPAPCRTVACLAALLLVAALPGLAAHRADMRDYWQSRPTREADVDALLGAADGSTLYLLDSDLVDAANGFNVWRAKPAGYFQNSVFVGSWLMNSPFEADTLARWAIANPYRESINRENVLVADYYRRALKEDHIRTHYNKNVTLELVEERGTFNLYRVTTQPQDGGEESGA